MKNYLITVPLVVLALVGLYFLGNLCYQKLTEESKKNAAIVSTLNSLCTTQWNLQPYFQDKATTTKVAIFTCSGGEDLVLK